MRCRTRERERARGRRSSETDSRRVRARLRSARGAEREVRSGVRPAPIAVSPHPSLFRQASARGRKEEWQNPRLTTRHPLNQERRSDRANQARIFLMLARATRQRSNNFAEHRRRAFFSARHSPSRLRAVPLAVRSRLPPPRVVAPTIPKPSRDMCDPPPTATRPVRSRDDATSARPTRRDVSAHDPMHAARASTTIADRLSKARRPRPVPRDDPRASRRRPPRPYRPSTLDPRPSTHAQISSRPLASPSIDKHSGWPPRGRAGHPARGAQHPQPRNQT